MFLDEDLVGGYSDGDLEQIAKGNELPPKGKYHVALTGAGPKTAQTSGATGTELVFTVASGAHAGHEFRETLWDTGRDDSATKKLTDRKFLFGSRLGLVVKDAAAGRYVLANGKRDLLDCLGHECVIEIDHEPYTNQKTGKQGVVARMTWAGIWRKDDPAAKAVVKTPTKPATPATATNTAPGQQRRQFDPSEL